MSFARAKEKQRVAHDKIPIFASMHKEWNKKTILDAVYTNFCKDLTTSYENRAKKSMTSILLLEQVVSSRIACPGKVLINLLFNALDFRQLA